MKSEQFDNRLFSLFLTNLLTSALLTSLLARHSFAFRIIDPIEDTKLTAGSTIPIQVDLGRDIGTTKVRYYWYGEQDEVMVEQDDSTATGSIVAHGSDGGFSRTGTRLWRPTECPTKQHWADAAVGGGRNLPRTIRDWICF